MPKSKRRPGPWVRGAAVALFYGLLIAIIAAPATFRLSSVLIGNNVDNWIFYWNDWWMAQALREGHNLMHTPYLFAPEGASLIAHSNAYLNSALALVLRPWIGPVAAYNSVVLLGLWIGAISMYSLAKMLTQNRAAALFAGVIFTLAPYHLTQALAHGHLGSIHWWPLFALSLHRLLARRRWTDALLSGALFALVFWTGLQLAVLIALWACGYLVWWAAATLRGTRVGPPEGGDGAWRPAFADAAKLLALAAVTAALLIAPLALPILRSWDSAWTAGFDRSGQDQTDLLAYVVPPTYNPFVGEAVVPVYERFVANRAYMPYLGIAVGVLILLSLRRRRGRGFWIAVCALSLVLAAGAFPRVNGVLYPRITLPYAWISDRFPISTIRAPDRFNLLVVFSAAVLAGFGVARIRARRWLLIGGLLLFAEYVPVPLPHWEPPPTSPFYDELAEEAPASAVVAPAAAVVAPASAVVDLPMGYTNAKLWLYHQTLHGRPMVEGHVSRYTPELYDLIRTHPLLRALYQPSLDDLPSLLDVADFAGASAPLPDLGPAVRRLTDDNVRHILRHDPYLDAAAIDQLRQALPLVPIHRDPTLTVYDLHRPLAATYGGLPCALAEGSDLVALKIEPTAGHRTWQIQVLARATRTGIAPLRCQVALEGDGIIAAAAPFTLFPAPEGELTWQAGDLGPWADDVILGQTLETGNYAWRVSCAQAPACRSPDTLHVDAAGGMIYARRRVAIRLGEAVRLTAYRWSTEDGVLTVDLSWFALETPSANLKTFVHLIDAQGAIRSQYDAVPCAWQCPTETWMPGETVADRATLDLVGLPGGPYTVAVGLYAAESGARLDAVGADGTAYADGYVVLPERFEITTSEP